MDYEKMWERLRNEMTDLMAKDVPTLAPAIALAYMEFIEQLEEKEEL